MIYVERGPAPPFFSSQAHSRLQAETDAHFEHYSSEKRRMRFTFKSAKFAGQVKPLLLERFASKCAYCESPFFSPQDANIDYFRPRNGARGFKEQPNSGRQGFYENLYWWLAWDWNNLLLACAICDTRKASWFPLVNEAVRATGPQSNLSQEQPLLLDPCVDTPEKHLRFMADGYVKALTARGEATIEILALNRNMLVTQRHSYLTELANKVKIVRAVPQMRVPSELSHVVLAATLHINGVYQWQQTIPYLGAQRQYLLELAANEPIILQLLDAAQNVSPISILEGNKDVSENAVYSPALTDFTPNLGRLSIERIELRNFKNIANLTLQVPAASQGGNASWLLFLGENAVGKSSVMQAIVLTLMGNDVRERITGLKPNDVLRYRQVRGGLEPLAEGWVKIWISGRPEPLQLSFRKGSNHFVSNVITSHSFLIAYGSTRLLPDKYSTGYEENGDDRVRVRHLFKASTPLVDAEAWLYSLYMRDPTGFDLIVRGLRDMLLMGDNDHFIPISSDTGKGSILVEFNSRREISTVSNLSDGYRTMLALACDMMSMLVQEGTSMEAAEGIVVIDELESNLHPSWKKRIVGCFRKVFPRVQFIVSTHDPLCLRGVFEHETVLLRRDSRQQIIAVTNLPNPNDLRIDELLTSEFFGLNATLDTDLEDIYNEYYQLLIKQHPTSTEQERLNELKKELQQREHLGHGLRDELMYEVIDKLIARERVKAKPKNRPELKKETLRKVLQAWEESGLLDDYATPA
jgi:uncharacterized protein (TIGR02646 family)